MKRCILMLIPMLFVGVASHAISQKDGVYQIGTPEEMLEFVNVVNAGETTASAQLTADVVVTFPDNVIIGMDGKDYKGTFDGQGHRLTVTIHRTGDGGGLFANIAAEGKVCNLIVDGTISGVTGCGTFAWQNFGTIENCVSLATVSTSANGFAACGGITCASVGKAIFRNVIFAGKLLGDAATNTSGFNWSENSGNPVYENCASIPAEVGVAEFFVWRQWAGNASYVNSYYAEAKGTEGAGNATLINSAALASGELCFRLNGDQSKIVYTQTLGEDAVPYPFTTHKQVYSTAALDCGGQPVGDAVSYTNTENVAVIPPHTYGDGFRCQVCGHVNEEFCQAVDGFYQIGTAQQMDWFAAMVNGGHADFSARLTADIDWSASSIVMGTGGNFNLQFMDGRITDNDYQGTFDGAGHRLTVNIDHQSGGTGIFAHIGANGKVCNIIIDGTISGTTGVGTFAWENWGTLENCVSLATLRTSCNGFAAMGAMTCASHGRAVYRNCLFAGKMLGEAATNTSGFNWSENGNNPLYENCASIPAEVGVAEFFVWRQWAGNADYVNSYYAEAKGTDGAGNATLINAAALASGELCFRLNGDQSKIVYTQTLGEDAIPYPSTSHKQVYSTAALNCGGQPVGDAVSYTNTENVAVIPPHTFGEGFLCSVCGALNTEYVSPVDGCYPLATANDVLWFCTMVNNGNTSMNACLTADVEVTFPDNVIIGVGGKDFQGTFDGQGHRLTATVHRSGDGCGLFANIGASGRVCNLVIDGTITGTTGCGSVAWQNFGTIENIVSLATVRASSYSGGITCASVGNAVFRNVIFAGTLDCGNASPIAGFSWWTNGGNPTYENCACIPQGVTAGGYFAWSEQDGNGSFRNCYYTDVNGTNRPGAAQLIDAAALSSGELCFRLNDSSVLAPTWRQNIGSDAIPTLNTTHGIVNEIGAAGSATQYIPGSAVEIPSGVSVFTGSVNAPWITLNPLSGIIPAGEAVVLQGAEGFYSFLPTISTPSLGNNELKGVAEPLQATGAEYVLAQKDGQVGFYQAEAGTTIPAGKAYVEYRGAEGVKAFFFGEATGIGSLQMADGQGSNGECYDLSGRRVEKAQKGIYIVNGKLRIMK